jgi:acyl-CoA synthetase (AMP-forming)/AMP-acid ligase II
MDAAAGGSAVARPSASAAPAAPAMAPDELTPTLGWADVTAAKLAGAPAGLLQPGAIPRRNARRFPAKTAYVIGGDRVDWAEVERQTDALAHGLRAAGIRPRDHVAVIGGNALAFIYAEFALMKAGATVVLVSPALTAPQLAGQLNHAHVSTVIAAAEVRDRLRSVEPELAARRFITWGAPAASGDAELTVEGLMSGHAAAGAFELADIRPGDAALVLYTSGTTGVPKGAVNTYFDFVIKLLTNSLSAEYREGETGLVVTPLCMGGTQVLSLMNYALLGMTAVIAPAFEPGAVLDLIGREHVSTALMVPTMTTALMNHPAIDDADLSSLDRIYSAGATLPLEVFERLRKRGIRVCEIYGSSETGGGVVISADEKDARPASVGRPKVGHEVRVVDDQDRPVPRGDVGEIIMRGDPVTAGYYEQPEIHAASFRHGWFHTGDLGYQDEDGYYYVIDRKKDMVVSGGTNVYPRDVEEVLYRVPGVAEAAVVGLPHPRWGEAVTAFVVPAAGAQLAPDAIIGACRHDLAPFQVPKQVVISPALPKTAMGKISKVALRSDNAGLYAPAGQERR